jgi:uncharacterized protein (TIGR02231 family)
MNLPMSSRLALSISTLALIVGAPALAAEIEAKSRVDAVVVYPDAALVTRVLDIDLPAGASTLVVRGLPASVDPASLRVAGAAAGQVAIGSVETRLAPAVEPTRDSAIEAKLRKLHGDLEAWQATLDALEAKKAMMIRFSQAGPEKLSPEAKPLDIAQWSAAWDVVGQGLAKIGDELVAARGRARDIDEEIRGLEQTRQRPPSVRPASREALVAIDAATAAKGSLSLTYRVAGAGWSPAYDARLDTANGARASLELVRRASVAQRTGEDWTGVTLSVSTTRAARGAQAPEVLTQRINFWEPPQPIALGGVARSAPSPVAKSSAMANQDAPAAPAPEEPRRRVDEREATLDAGAYQASFLIPGRVDIPGDGSARGFRVSTATFAPELVARVAPSLDPTAYLQARIVNAEDAPLLPGAINITRDGEFVGVSRIGLVAPGDGVELGFGADDRVTVTRAPVKRKENDPSWIGTTKTEQREFKTTIRNLHAFPVKVGVIDRIPVSENSAIVIEQSPNTTPPTEKIVNDRRGVMGWTFDLAPGAGKDIVLAYRMKWPADREVVFDTPPAAVRF